MTPNETLLCQVKTQLVDRYAKKKRLNFVLHSHHHVLTLLTSVPAQGQAGGKVCKLYWGIRKSSHAFERSSRFLVTSKFLEEESKDLATKMLPPRLLVVHDAAAGGQHHKPKLTGGKQVVGPLLDVSDANIEPMVTNIDQAV